MFKRLFEWDIFLAHAGSDTDSAEVLYELLSESAKVFLDSRSLELGDDWDQALMRAQSSSLITVVLVSTQTDQAYYQREEIAAAIQMAREDPEAHRVIPVFLEEQLSTSSQVPYGLRMKHGLQLSPSKNFENIALQLLSALNKQRGQIIIYDGRKNDVAFDFKGRADSFWTGKGSDSRRTSPIGEGVLTFQLGGVLNIKRTKAEGRYEIHLLEYEYSGVKVKSVPKNDNITGDRKLRIHCEVRSVTGKHGLRFVVKNEASQTWLANEKRMVEGNEWVPIDIYFRVDPTYDFWFRIDHEEVSQIPSEVQIRGLVLAEMNN
jgi:hypothetical protein